MLQHHQPSLAMYATDSDTALAVNDIKSRKQPYGAMSVSYAQEILYKVLQYRAVLNEALLKKNFQNRPPKSIGSPMHHQRDSKKLSSGNPLARHVGWFQTL